ncbi:hypothetical protein L6R46_02905 [Myxococcota bacterium]|nr:hypothetical protein [Myxococcota bacterium]
MLLLSWFVASAEAACVERVTADTLTTRVQALVEPVAFAEDSVAAELDAIEAALRAGCLEMTIPRDTLGALFMAQGAYELLRGGDPVRADAYLRRAAALTAPIEPAYGLKVEEAYRAAINGMRGDAILELSFPTRPEVVVVDGEVIYDAVERRVLLGAHLVQWYSADLGWSAEWVELNVWGERRLVGGGPPLPDELGPLPDEPDKAPRAKTPRAKPPRPERAPAPLSVTGLVGYALSVAPEITTEDLRADALGFMPTLNAEARLGALSVSGRLSPGASPMPMPTDSPLGGPALPNELRALYGLRRDKPLSLGVGLLLLNQPTVAFERVLLTAEGAQVAVEAPSFGAAPGAGPLLSVGLGGGESSLWSASARVAWTSSPEAGAAASGALAAQVALPVGPVRLILGAELGALKAMESQPGPWLYPQVVGGAQWSR